MLPISQLIAFSVMSLTSITLTLVGLRKILLNISSSGTKVGIGQILKKLPAAIFEYISLRRTFKTRPTTTIFHAMIAWGFLTFLVINLNDVIYAFCGFRLLNSIGMSGNIYRSISEAFNIMILVGITALSLRRFIFQPSTFSSNSNVLYHPKAISGIKRDSAIVASFIFLHNASRLIGESAYISQFQCGYDRYQPITSIFANFLFARTQANITNIEHLMFWLSIGAVAIFLPYFPKSKHIHIFFVPFNLALKPNHNGLVEMTPIDLEDEQVESFGAKQVSELSAPQVADAYSCIMCFRCQDVCPAHQTGKPLSPAVLEINKRYALNESKANDIELLTLITEEAVWSCTTCGACVEICPVGNEPMKDILDIRRNLALMESKFPKQLESAFKGMERNSNPWNTPTSDRIKWSEGLNVPVVGENKRIEILWWVGCAPSTDPRAQKVAKAFAEILNNAGVDFAILGSKESCTGDSARRAGREDIFIELASRNIEVLNKVDPALIVTTCPHCLNTIRNEYPQFGGNYKVIHHSELINNLVGDGRIEFEKGMQPSITYHDPCYLGRHNQEYSEARALIGSIGKLEPMEYQGSQSICCGAGGAQFWKEETGNEKMGMQRYMQAETTGAEILATGCPFCLTMLSDANTAANSSMPVLDIAEIVATNMVRKLVP